MGRDDRRERYEERLRVPPADPLLTLLPGYGTLAVARSTPKSVIQGGRLVQVAANLPGAGEGGLLVEGAHLNQMNDSNDFGNSNWGVVNLALSGGVPGADGSTTSGSRLTDDASNGAHQLYFFANDAVAQDHTAAFLLKAGSLSWAMVYTNYGGFGGAYFNLAAGTVGTVVGSGISAFMVPIGGGYFACFVTFATSSGWFPAGTYAPLVVAPASGDGGYSYQGTGSGYVDLAGADLFGGDVGFSHVITGVNATASCAADVVTVPGLVLPLATGRIELDFTPMWPKPNNTPALLDSRNGGGAGLWFGFLNTNAPVFAFGGPFLAVGGGYAVVPGQRLHFKVTWGGGNCALFINDVLQGAVTDGSAAPPTAHALVHLGNDYTGNGHANGLLANLQVHAQ